MVDTYELIQDWSNVSNGMQVPNVSLIWTMMPLLYFNERQYRYSSCWSMMVLQLRLLLSKFGESHARFLKTFVFENYFNKKYWVQYSHMVLCEMPIMPPLCTALNEYHGINSFLFKICKSEPFIVLNRKLISFKYFFKSY